MFEGTMTAMVTPFTDGELDRERLRANVDEQIQSGIDGLIPCGTTGESPTLTHQEHRTVVELTVEQANGRVPVLAGAGSNSTREALELARHAREVGAAAGLLVSPYYNKPTQEGLYRHFVTVADEVGLPLVLYNIPGRTGVTILPETIERLATHEKIVGVKEATGSMDSASEIAQRCDPEQFTILSGDDSLTLPMMAVGARGVISVISNLLPERMKAMVEPARANDVAAARAEHLALFPLMRAMFYETNPIPIKTALAIAGRDTGELRLPLCPMASDTHAKLERILRTTGVTAQPA